MSELFFTSDTHYFHKKMAAHRGFDSVEVMNDYLIFEWNQRVGRDDIVYHLGDFSFAGHARTAAIVERLNGRIRLVPGNHDKGMSTKTHALFDQVLPPIQTLKVPIPRMDGTGVSDVYRFVLCHFPLLVWDMAHYGAMHLHGHSHGNLRFPNPSARIMDVGVDANEVLAPVSFAEVMQHMIGSDYKPFDQHEENQDE